MYTFKEYCDNRDESINEVDWRGLADVAKQKLGKWFTGEQPPEPEQKVNIGGKQLGASDVSVGGLGRTLRPKLSPEDVAIASRLGRNIESRMSNTSLERALTNYGYTNSEAKGIIDQNPAYEPMWNKYLISNENIKNIYLNAWKEGQRDTVRRMLQKMFDQAIGKNVIGMPALLVRQPEPKAEIPPVSNRDIVDVAKKLILSRPELSPDKVIDELKNKFFSQYMRKGIHLPSLHGRMTAAYNAAIRQLNQKGRLGPRRIARGTEKVVPQQPVEPGRLRLYQ